MKTILLAVILLPAVLHAGGIYWSNRGAGLLERASYDGAGRTTVLANAGSNVRGLALDLTNNRIYYADNGADILYRLNLDGTNRSTVLVLGSSFPADLKLNLTAGHLYYCDQQNGLIRRINLDGSSPATLVTDTTYQPYYMDLDLAAGKIYWGDFDGVTANTGNVFRMNLDGSGRETVVTGTRETRAVCVDPAGGMLYWVNRNAGKIMRCLLADLPVNAATSPAVQTLYAGLDTPHGMTLDVPAGRVYWVDTGTNGFPNTTGDQGVSRGDMDGSGPQEVLASLGSEPWDIEVDPRCATYAEWTARFFPKNPGAAADPAGDPDQDGIPNIMECALGLHPLRAETGGLPAVATITEAGETYPAIRFIRRTGVAGLQVLAQHGTNLASWWDKTSLLAIAPPITETEVTPLAENLERVTVRSVTSLSQNPRQYLRVKVVLTP